MMTSSNETFPALLAICAGNSPVTGEFPAQRPVMRSFDVFFDLRLNKRLSKQSWGWWFETPSHPLWRHCSEFKSLLKSGHGRVIKSHMKLRALLLIHVLTFLTCSEVPGNILKPVRRVFCNWHSYICNKPTYFWACLLPGNHIEGGFSFYADRIMTIINSLYCGLLAT